MKNPFRGIAGILKPLAPTLAKAAATAVTGPAGPLLAGAAMAGVRKALGLSDDAAPDAIEARLGHASAEELQALQTAEAEFRVRRQEILAEMQRIAADDRADARQRELAIRDKTPTRIAYIDSFLLGVALVGVGFLAWQLGAGETNLNDAVVALVSSALTGVITMARSSREYYFGSSAEPATRTDNPRNDR